MSAHDERRARLVAQIEAGEPMTAADLSYIAQMLSAPGYTFAQRLYTLAESEGDADRRLFYRRLLGNVEKFLDMG